MSIQRINSGLITGVNASALPAGSVLQVVSTTVQGLISTTVQGSPDVITNGAQVFSISFTPSSASSSILVQTSSVAISESSNFADMCWLALWNGSTFVAANSGTWSFNSFANARNAAYITINEVFAASNTATRTIQVRAGMNSGVGTTSINGNLDANYGADSRQQIRMVVMEIAA
jgi:hypothetical protein